LFSTSPTFSVQKFPHNFWAQVFLLLHLTPLAIWRLDLDSPQA
jgi:hypothetical protein